MHRHSDSGPLEFRVFSLVTTCPWHLYYSTNRLKYLLATYYLT